MGQFAAHVSRELGVSLPQDYAGFMDTHGSKLSEDPVQKESWIGGLGSSHFVIGTTLAFRARLANFRTQNVVIGYVGIKTIVVNKAYEEIDEYLVLDTRDGTVLTVDSLGATNQVAASFEEWVGPELLRATLREKHASNLTVILFDDPLKAEEARLKLMTLWQEGFIDLEDAVVVVKKADGTVQQHQMHKPARKGGLAGSITGLVVGSIFFSPLIGAVFGAVTGAVSAALSDIGVDDKFIKDLTEQFKPGSSALFALVRKADAERVGKAFLGFGGKVLVNSVSREREAAIQSLLDAAGERVE